jgi:hypothetical protein
MKKNYLLILAALLASQLFFAQSTETFEGETPEATSFTDNGQVFTISSQSGGAFHIFYDGTVTFGWNGTSKDNAFIDNSSTTGNGATNGVNVGFTISSQGATPFTLKKFYAYLAEYEANLVNTGTMTVTGKLGGVTQFTATLTSGTSNTSYTYQNGFTLIDLTTLGGSDNSNTSIDTFVITTTGDYEYISLDAMTWQAAATCTEPDIPTVTASANTICSGNITTLYFSGDLNDATQWAIYTGSCGGTLIGATTGSSFSFVPSSTTTYYVRGEGGCSTAGSCGSITITVSSVNATITSQTNVSCNSETDGSATVAATAGTAPYTYLWSNGATTATITDVAAGTYNATVTDANGCTGSTSVTITEPAALVASITSQTNVSCSADPNGDATVAATAGTAPYSYLWSNGATTETITDISAGTYNVTVTDANGCTDMTSVTITDTTIQPDIPTVTASANTICSGNITTLYFSGDLNDATQWAIYTGSCGGTLIGATTGSSFSFVPSSTTTYYVRGEGGCSTAGSCGSITITVSSVSATVASQTNISCNGGTDGSATVVATAGTTPYTYLWSNDATTATITDVAAGTYNVTVTDANGCTGSTSVTITEPAALVASITSQTNVSCNGEANGAATVAATGGTAPYTYLWSNGATTATITGVTAATYEITITDANGCADITSVTLTEPAAIDNTVSELVTGTLTANEAGAAYQWYLCPTTLLTGETNQSFTPTDSGEYQVVITVGTCTAISDCKSMVTLGSASFEKDTTFVIYPNPVASVLNISNTTGTEVDNVTIYDLSGALVLSTQKTNTISLSGLASGTYLVKIKSGDRIETKKIIKK